MPFIGNSVQNQGFAPAVDYYNGDGTTVTFTLSRPVASVAQLTAVIENVIQNPATAFTVSGNSITFTSAPPSGTNNIWVEYTSLITTYAAISQDPSVVGDITASGGYLAEGDFGNSYIDGTIVDYVTGMSRITTGPIDDMTFYHGGTSARSEMMTLYYAGGAKVFGNTALTIPVGTTAQRPTGAFGMIRANSTTGYIEYWDTATSTWIGIGAFAASGGTVTTVGSYTYHTFTSSGTFSVISGAKSVDYLIVAGGGSGGGMTTGGSFHGAGGGGGAGGYVTGTFTPTAGNYSITIGAGGAGVNASVGNSGANSSISGFGATTAVGGGYGGRGNSGQNAASGGSGGGGTREANPSGGGTSGQGNAGATYPGGSGGGGGGGGGAGASGSGGGNSGGPGGVGLQWLNGTFYAGGGGGAEGGNVLGGAGAGGNGGGGTGAVNSTNGLTGGNATANTGGGGGGGGSAQNNSSSTAGGNGGSGIVIIRYLA